MIVCREQIRTRCAHRACRRPRYEAENSPAACTGTIDSDWPGYSGSSLCDAANATGAYAQFSVNASTAGTTTLETRFATGTTTANPASLIVNGSMAQTSPTGR